MADQHRKPLAWTTEKALRDLRRIDFPAHSISIWAHQAWTGMIPLYAHPSASIDLLDALKVIVADCSQVWTEDEFPALKQARAAIAKATPLPDREGLS